MRRLVVATTNRGKLKEIAQLLAGVAVNTVELLTLADFPPVTPPQETGQTFAENARLKALFYARHTGELTVAEDSGLEIDALGGAPGVESARFGGEQSTYPEKFALIYDALNARKAATSPARFVCALALVKDSRVLLETRGTVEGAIAPEPRGTGGFGYDPIFFYPPFGVTLAEATQEQKSSVSHRGKAFRTLGTYLKTLNTEIAENAE
jgi:XTP/dITP diphosphohydrolase